MTAQLLQASEPATQCEAHARISISPSSAPALPASPSPTIWRRTASAIILEREHVPAYHTTGRSAALHSETYGSAEIRAITVASGRFYRKPPPGLRRPSAADAARRADRRPRRPGRAPWTRPPPSTHAWCRRVRRLDAERDARAVQPFLKPRRLRRRRGLRGRGRRHGRGRDPRRLPEGRARRRRACCASMPR